MGWWKGGAYIVSRETATCWRHPPFTYALVNGAPVILFVLGDQVVGAVAFDITNGKSATVRSTAAWRQHEPDTPLIIQW